jgi:RNA polymerase sigma-70 factor (ECF subfamily)
VNDERALVEGVLAGAPGAFESLVQSYQGLCWHIIYRLVKDPETSRDLCQETFLRVYRKLHQYRHDSPLKGWIGRVAYTIALRHLERQAVRAVDTIDSGDESIIESVASDFDLEQASVDRELMGHLRAEIDRLAPVPRAVLSLYHLEDLSIDEIGEITGLPSGTIKSHLFRARLQLRKALESLWR